MRHFTLSLCAAFAAFLLLAYAVVHWIPGPTSSSLELEPPESQPPPEIRMEIQETSTGAESAEVVLNPYLSVDPARP